MPDGYVGDDDYVRTYAGVVGDEHGDYDCAGNRDDRDLLVMVGRLVGPLVPAGWPVGPSWLAGWSLLVGRLVPFVGPVGPFCWTVDLICLAPVGSGWIAGMCCLAGPGWFVRTLVLLG